jgi:hypothetical protein
VAAWNASQNFQAAVMDTSDGINWIMRSLGQLPVLYGVTGNISGTTLTMTGSQTLIQPGQMVIGNGVATGTVIVSGSGTTYVVNISQTVTGSPTLTFLGLSPIQKLAIGDRLSGIIVGVSNSTSLYSAISSSIVGPALLIEHSQGNQTEGWPDLFVVSNQAGFLPDASRIV